MSCTTFGSIGRIGLDACFRWDDVVILGIEGHDRERYEKERQKEEERQKKQEVKPLCDITIAKNDASLVSAESTAISMRGWSSQVDEVKTRRRVDCDSVQKEERTANITETLPRAKY